MSNKSKPIPSSGIAPSVTASNGFNVILTRKKNNSTNYHIWVESTSERLKLLYPNIYDEFLTAVPVETPEETYTRLSLGLGVFVLENDKSKVLSDEDFGVIAALPAASRARATEKAVEAMQLERATRNASLEMRRAVSLSPWYLFFWAPASSAKHVW